MKSVRTIMCISIGIRRELEIELVLMYGSEARTISKLLQKKAEATEMGFFMIMLGSRGNRGGAL